MTPRLPGPPREKTGIAVRPITLDVGPKLSGLVAHPKPGTTVRGLLVALHGGGTRAAYWDSPVDPKASLVRAGARRGWRVLALDRPGYGASASLVAGPRRLRVADQAPFVERAIEQVRPGGAPVVVVGHSMGAILTVHLAAAQRPSGLAMIAIGGIPLAFTEEQVAGLATVDTSGTVVSRPEGAAHRDSSHWYGPDGTWDRRLLDHREELVTKTPTGEFLDARCGPAVLPYLLALVRVPVHVAAAEYERTTAPATTVLGGARDALVASARVRAIVVRDSGHNLSLGRQGRNYHSDLLDFADESSVGRNDEPPTTDQ